MMKTEVDFQYKPNGFGCCTNCHCRTKVDIPIGGYGLRTGRVFCGLDSKWYPELCCCNRYISRKSIEEDSKKLHDAYLEGRFTDMTGKEF